MGVKTALLPYPATLAGVGGGVGDSGCSEDAQKKLYSRLRPRIGERLAWGHSNIHVRVPDFCLPVLSFPLHTPCTFHTS